VSSVIALSAVHPGLSFWTNKSKEVNET